MPSGFLVANLLKDSGIRGQYGADVVKKVEFRFVDESVKLFKLHPKSGHLQTATLIDRDAKDLCYRQERCFINLTVVARPLPHMSIMKVVVEIEDVNDNQPEFKETKFHLKINEATSINSAFLLPLASDADSPAYGIFNYTLTSDSNHFSLVTTNIMGTKGFEEVKLVLVEPLDREKEDEYHLKLQVYDEAFKAAQLEIVIEVLDANDNSPRFSRAHYDTAVAESDLPGKVLFKLSASDADLGANGLVRYFLSPNSASQHGKLFTVDEDDGRVVLAGDLDRERSSVYELVITSRDQGTYPKHGEATLTIKVTDVNDNRPVVVVSSINGVNTTDASVRENASEGTFVAHVVATDLDEGLNGKVTCVLTPNKNASFVQMASAVEVEGFKLVQKRRIGEYQMVTTKVLDREEQEWFEVHLRCYDHGHQQLSTYVAVQVEILDVNDNSPNFSKSLYTTSLMENNVINASVLKVQATDADKKLNGKISYVLLNEDGKKTDYFRVDEAGLVRVARKLDRERVSKHSLTVLAVDRGQPSRTGSAQLVVEVKDDDDEVPTFLNRSYHFQLHENLPAGTEVGQVRAVDLDQVEAFKAFDYHILDKHIYPDAEFFTVNHQTGFISTTRSFDRESFSSCHFRVMARSQLEAKSSTAQVSVEVLDVDDNPPILVFPSSFNDTVHVPVDASALHQVVRVLAFDADSTPQFNDLTFQMQHVRVFDEEKQIQEFKKILNGSDYLLSEKEISSNESHKYILQSSRDTITQLFSIDPNNGWIKTKEETSKYSGLTFCLEVSVFNTIYSSYFINTDLQNISELLNISETNKTNALTFEKPQGSRSHRTAVKRTAYLFMMVDPTLKSRSGKLVSKWWRINAGSFQDFGGLLFYFIAAAGGGCLVVMFVVVMAALILKRKVKRQGAARLRKLNGNAALIDCLANNKVFETKDSKNKVTFEPGNEVENREHSTRNARNEVENREHSTRNAGNETTFIIESYQEPWVAQVATSPIKNPLNSPYNHASRDKKDQNNNFEKADNTAFLKSKDKLCYKSNKTDITSDLSCTSSANADAHCRDPSKHTNTTNTHPTNHNKKILGHDSNRFIESNKSYIGQVGKILPPPPPPTRGNFWKPQKASTLNQQNHYSFFHTSFHKKAQHPFIPQPSQTLRHVSNQHCTSTPVYLPFSSFSMLQQSTTLNKPHRYNDMPHKSTKQVSFSMTVTKSPSSVNTACLMTDKKRNMSCNAGQPIKHFQHHNANQSFLLNNSHAPNSSVEYEKDTDQPMETSSKQSLNSPPSFKTNPQNEPPSSQHRPNYLELQDKQNSSNNGISTSNNVANDHNNINNVTILNSNSLDAIFRQTHSSHTSKLHKNNITKNDDSIKVIKSHQNIKPANKIIRKGDFGANEAPTFSQSSEAQKIAVPSLINPPPPSYVRCFDV